MLEQVKVAEEQVKVKKAELKKAAEAQTKRLVALDIDPTIKTDLASLLEQVKVAEEQVKVKKAEVKKAAEAQAKKAGEVRHAMFKNSEEAQQAKQAVAAEAFFSKCPISLPNSTCSEAEEEGAAKTMPWRQKLSQRLEANASASVRLPASSDGAGLETVMKLQKSRVGAVEVWRSKHAQRAESRSNHPAGESSRSGVFGRNAVDDDVMQQMPLEEVRDKAEKIMVWMHRATARNAAEVNRAQSVERITDALRSFSGDLLLWRAEAIAQFGYGAVKANDEEIIVHGMRPKAPSVREKGSQTRPTQTKAGSTQTHGACFRSRKRNCWTQTEASVHPSAVPIPMHSLFRPQIIPVPVLGPSMLPVGSIRPSMLCAPHAAYSDDCYYAPQPTDVDFFTRDAQPADVDFFTRDAQPADEGGCFEEERWDSDAYSLPAPPGLTPECQPRAPEDHATPTASSTAMKWLDRDQLIIKNASASVMEKDLAALQTAHNTELGEYLGSNGYGYQ